MDVGAVGDINILDGQGIKNLGGGSPADSVGQVVIADEEEDGDAIGGEAVNALGELSLLGLGGLTALIGITAEEDKVNLVFQGIIDHLVQSFYEIGEA